ncbi:MAG: carbohydrate ABC transporter permease [Bacillota bacterium]|jgi:multiple sugar transport system permease protein|nr:carbohydrate ABC transporter permease [Bacillota bacterium]NLL26578.1 carbohydrate ABC transporter permease [Erysipelotrichia bacterium]
MRTKNFIKYSLIYIILGIGAVFMIFPFFWMIMGGFKTAQEISAFPPLLFPSHFNLDNFKFALDTAPFAKYFVNSVVVTVSSVTLSTMTTILAAFAFSRLEFKGRDALFTLLLALMMVPFEMIVITNYRTIINMGLLNTRVALIIPFTSSIFYTYILRNFFVSIPESFYRSAKIDGCSNWQYLWKVMVPMARPSLVTIILLNSISAWNSFFWPMLVTNTSSARTLPFGLYTFMTEGGARNEYMMAAATIVVLPMMILFLFARKYIVTGVSKGGLKG